jgi:hypothetical protein
MIVGLNDSVTCYDSQLEICNRTPQTGEAATAARGYFVPYVAFRAV